MLQSYVTKRPFTTVISLLCIMVCAWAVHYLNSTNPLYDRYSEEQYLYTETGPAVKGQVFVISEESDSLKSIQPLRGRTVRVPIIIYHSVRPYIPKESLEQDTYDVTPELFEEELRYLKDNNYTTISFTELHSFLANGTPLPQRAVILSFDDGWKNQFIYAYPLLKKYSMTGTFFIFSGAIGSRSSFMTWDDVLVMHRGGMHIEGHSYTHPILTKTFGEQNIYRELTMSKRVIESHTGTAVTVFAYPFGMYDDRIMHEVARAGYTLARTTKNTAWHSEGALHSIGGTLSSDSLSDFITTVSGGTTH